MKKSPLEIAKEDWKKEIENGEINIEFLEKYAGAYDVSKTYILPRTSDYSHVLNSYMLLKENKFDLAKKSFKLISNNYLEEFYEFINNTSDNQSGLIGNGTIDIKEKINNFFFFSGLNF